MTALILLTIRELRAKLIIVGLFAVATFVWLMLTFALNLDIVDGTLAGMRIFGQEAALAQQVEVRNEETGEIEVETIRPFGENPLESLVISVQQGVAGITFWVVLLLGLFATGSLVASMMERGQVDLLLSKPVARSTLLGGRLLGVGAVVAALVVYVLGAVWLVISIKSGIWNGSFLLGVMVVLTMFAVLYGIVTLVSVWTESTALAMIVALGVIVASLVLMAPDEAVLQINRPWREIYVGLYYFFPNFPAATAMTWTLAGGEAVEDWVPFLTSLAFGAACYAASFALFQRKDF